MSVVIKRVYEPASKADGFRVLVDRLWPRGISKERADLDVWLKEVAPTPELREWFDHEPAKFAEFTKRYELELESNPALGELRQMVKDHPTVTLLYAAHDPQINHAVVLLQVLEDR
jgi:uncharacterized protein YeaO (DUF488 family)